MMVVATTDQLMELDRRNMMFFKNYWMLEVVDPGDEGELDSRVLQDQTEEVYLANSDENSCDEQIWRRINIIISSSSVIKEKQNME